MDKFVVGFAFYEPKGQVLLVRKNRPEWQSGFLNGIGGKIENGESPLNAMRREGEEEIGLGYLEWIHRGVMKGQNNDGNLFECHVFYSYDDTIINFQQKEDEPLALYCIDEIHQEKIISNLAYLIPLGCCGDGYTLFSIDY